MFERTMFTTVEVFFGSLKLIFLEGHGLVLDVLVQQKKKMSLFSKQLNKSCCRREEDEVAWLQENTKSYHIRTVPMGIVSQQSAPLCVEPTIHGANCEIVSVETVLIGFVLIVEGKNEKVTGFLALDRGNGMVLVELISC